MACQLAQPTAQLLQLRLERNIIFLRDKQYLMYFLGIWAVRDRNAQKSQLFQIWYIPADSMG